MLKVGVQTSSGASALADQDAMEIMAAQAMLLEEQRQEAARKVAKTDGAVVFYTAFPNSNFVYSDGVFARFRGNELIVKDEAQIAELRKAVRSGAPLWEMG